MALASQSHDGLPLDRSPVERSSHMEEYTRMRPASAGSRPRSLLNKMATAAAAQVEDEPEPPDAEPWVLEGWGDGPSVSEAAQQAALKLGPYNKNVPTTLVGLGVAAPGRRVLSAGPQGRSPARGVDPRRKPGASPGPGPPYGQERRASGPAGASGGGAGSSPGGSGYARPAVVRRPPPPPQNMDVGDESDVDIPTPVRRPPAQAPAPAPAPPPSAGTPPRGPARAPASTVPRAPPTTSTIRQIHSSLPPQVAQAQSTAGAVKRISRPTREAPSGGGGVPAQPGSSGSAPGALVPPSRSASADACHPHGSGLGASAAAASARSPYLAAVRGGGMPASNFAQPSHPHVHLEPLSPLQGRLSNGRNAGVPSDSGAAPAQPGRIHVPRSSSFTSGSAGRGTGSGHSVGAAGGGEEASSGGQLAPLSLPSPSGPAATPPGAPPPPLPGLKLTGRRGSSFRTDAGLSGWDPDAPPVMSPQSPGQANNSPSLWIGPSAPGAGTSGLQVGNAASSGRGSPLSANTQARREQLAGNSRLRQSPGPGAGPSSGAAGGPLDLALGPERSTTVHARPSRAPLGSGRSAGASPEASMFGYMEAESSGGIGGGGGPSGGGNVASAGGACGEPKVPPRTGTLSGLLPTGPPAGSAMPMRVTPLTAAKAPAATAARVG
ncbi:hypothetical protein HYH03_002209 [Edaphochlamys debaryana]|uniref:Uncharacterized protein n=1 Tax=Edaphochlamys debaryana TaxID=47281 RepID=A0A835YBL0_9CHLO|nr:hypothetical protein HYH03_002209 [Edaphochlamys debaryana]|eukprot:KAG2499922.1 hypothetical protein HYH03_002209 [Edaphochlamys debaryana]